MPTNDPIAAARREAKSRARNGGITHQQALDAIARENGHATWSAMTLAATDKPIDPVRAYIDLMRPNGGIAPDDELRALLEDAMNGYLAEPEGSDITVYVDNYEFRGDGADYTPNAFQRDIIQIAIEGYMDEDRARKGLRGPYHHMPFQIDEFPILEGPYSPPVSFTKETETNEPAPTIAEVERDTKRLIEDMASSGADTGLTISQWVSERMGADARKALKKDTKPFSKLSALPMTTDNIAYAMDPSGGPYDNQARITVRCPLHGKDGPERNPSLLIAGTTMKCMSGCASDKLEDHLVERLCEAADKAKAFMKRNDASLVYTGHSNNSKGGMGGTYGLNDKSFHRMDTLTCRLLPKGYPKWQIGATS